MLKKIKTETIIETMLDLKRVLECVDEKELDKVGIGTNDEGDGEISLVVCADDGEFMSEKQQKMFDKLGPVNNYIKRILEAHNKQLKDEEFTSEGFI